jgi:hypothetical protein
MSQSDPIFRQAFDNVRSRHSAREWLLISPQQVTQEIYAELRRLDFVRGEEMVMQPKRTKKATDGLV